MLVSRFRRLYCLAARPFTSVGTKRDTSNSMNLVRLLDLTFLRQTRGNTGRNVKSAALAFEARRDLHMRAVAKLVDRRDRNETITAVHQNLRIPGKGRGIARYSDDDWHGGGCELARLHLCALAWRVEYDGIEPRKLGRGQRLAKQVAPLRRDRLEPRRCGRTRERGKRRRIAVDGGDLAVLGEPQREG